MVVCTWLLVLQLALLYPSASLWIVGYAIAALSASTCSLSSAWTYTGHRRQLNQASGKFCDGLRLIFLAFASTPMHGQIRTPSRLFYGVKRN